MDALFVIPARMAASRLPGKPLAEIGGEAMIVKVWRRASEAGLGRVLVAAAEEEIAAAVRRAGGEAVLTDPALPSGSDRVHAAVEAVDPRRRHDLVVNLQGDQPLIPPATIAAALAPFEAGRAPDIATLGAVIVEPREADDPNVVKAAVALPDGPARPGAIGRALYFSRARIPTGEGPLLHHIGIYAYARAALDRFVALPPSPLERRERLEQLRALEAGLAIDLTVVDKVPIAVDTPGDLERARAAHAAAAKGGEQK
ncbi:MAG: 3-deoxy-manno-octulosonate cytidylyltransferase [Alphaproteobacteria bacterium]|nr:3-deoxy-manno-octulosonate cytidylyltransferase [Alphaproteobacteria bacterium]